MIEEISSYYPVILIIILGLGFTSFVQASDIKMNESGSLALETGSDFIRGDARNDLFSLINFLTGLGLDASYGNNGDTIFSMIGYSLSKVITVLATGNVAGIESNPLILETFHYVNISESDIILNTDNVSGNLNALDGYFEYKKNNCQVKGE